MPPKKHSFARPPRRERSPRKMFVLAVEGKKTEPQYFAIFKYIANIKYATKPSSKSSPNQVLGSMKKHLKQNPLKDYDEAWIVVDRDEWDEQALNELLAWAQDNDNCHMALSNPKFEYWLLLHFEDGDGVTTARDCDIHLKKHLRNYNKGITAADFPDGYIEHATKAIKRAVERKHKSPPCDDWPRTPGNTTVYRLVQNILDAMQRT